MTLQSRCHCGATRLTIKQPPARVTDCNCTFCAKHGALWAYYEVGDVSLDQTGDTSTYSSDPDDHQHHFCRICGCMSFSDQKRSWNEDGSRGGPQFAINVKLLDGFDIGTVPVERLDGLNQW